MSDLNTEMATLRKTNLMHVSVRQYRSMGGKSLEVEFLLEPHTTFIQDYLCLQKKLYCHTDDCARLFPSFRAVLNWSIPCVSRDLSDAMQNDYTFIKSWMAAMDKWMAAVGKLEQHNMLPIQIRMRKWYTDMMNGEVRGIDQLQKSLATKGTHKQAYAAFFQANRRGLLRASLFLVLMKDLGFISGRVFLGLVGGLTIRAFIKNIRENQSRKRPRESSRSASGGSASNKHKKNSPNLVDVG